MQNRCIAVDIAATHQIQFGSIHLFVIWLKKKKNNHFQYGVLDPQWVLIVLLVNGKSNSIKCIHILNANFVNSKIWGKNRNFIKYSLFHMAFYLIIIMHSRRCVWHRQWIIIMVFVAFAWARNVDLLVMWCNARAWWWAHFYLIIKSL